MADKFTKQSVADGVTAVWNTTGSNNSIEEQLDLIDVALFAFDDQDQAGGGNGTTSETKMAEVTIAANSVNTGVLVIATGNSINSSAAPTSTIRLRAGTDQATPTNNTQYKSITRSNSDTNQGKTGWTIVYFINDLTFTSTNYVQITGFMSLNNLSVNCESLVVLAI